MLIYNPFYLSISEFKYGEFQKLIGEARIEAFSQSTLADNQGWGKNPHGNWVYEKSYNWNRTGYTQSDDHPVININAIDANLISSALTQLLKETYWLPSESEWEYAVRAGSDTRYFWGNERTPSRQYAWYALGDFANPQPACQKQPNPFGLYDVYGNVWELCYTDFTQITDDIIRWRQHSTIIRGGGFWDTSTHCPYSAQRFQCSPDLRLRNAGIRLALSANSVRLKTYGKTKPPFEFPFTNIK